MAEQEETAKPCWSHILKTQAPPKPTPTPGDSLAGDAGAGNCQSTKGIAVAVVDANAIIDGGEKLSRYADTFVSVQEVMDEVRDPVSRHRLAALPFAVDTMEPSPESLTKVIKFARATGDLQTLSEVDLKLIALTYTLEAQIHGTERLREAPPPIHTVNVKRLPEKELPGWGSNVPNLAEWEALEDQAEDKPNGVSRILPLKDLNSGVVSNEVKEDVKKYLTEKKEVNLEAKKMVAEGIDASNGESYGDDENWIPAVSRSTHRRFLRRKARREYYDSLSEKNGDQENVVRQAEENDDGESLSTVMEEMRLEDGNGNAEELDDVEIASETNDESVGDSSGQSWTIGSLSESTVACVTTDFAMQNVILQMGLRLVAPGGMQIRKLQRWVLRCHACYTVTVEIGKIFCPKCGNGGTLRKVAVTVGEDGITLAARRPRVTLRGTKFSLPSPHGGRDAMTKNPILREDQLPQKYLHPKTKKKVNKDEGDDFFVRGLESIFSVHHSDKRSFQPPVGKALAYFSGKRNPNDNHYSRSKRK